MERKLETISFAAHEAAMFRKERIIKRLIETIVVSEMIFAAVCVILFSKGGRK